VAQQGAVWSEVTLLAEERPSPLVERVDGPQVGGDHDRAPAACMRLIPVGDESGEDILAIIRMVNTFVR